MTTAKQKAEAYVREKLPELMKLSFGCEVRMRGFNKPIIYINRQGNDGISDQYLDGDGNIVCTAVENEIEIIGHPIQLQHWLRVLGDKCGQNKVGIDAEGYLLIRPTYANRNEGNKEIFFDMLTGQPATEADYQALCSIFGI